MASTGPTRPVAVALMAICALKSPLPSSNICGLQEVNADAFPYRSFNYPTYTVSQESCAAACYSDSDCLSFAWEESQYCSFYDVQAETPGTSDTAYSFDIGCFDCVPITTTTTSSSSTSTTSSTSTDDDYVTICEPLPTDTTTSSQTSTDTTSSSDSTTTTTDATTTDATTTATDSATTTINSDTATTTSTEACPTHVFSDDFEHGSLSDNGWTHAGKTGSSISLASPGDNSGTAASINNVIIPGLPANSRLIKTVPTCAGTKYKITFNFQFLNPDSDNAWLNVDVGDNRMNQFYMSLYPAGVWHDGVVITTAELSTIDLSFANIDYYNSQATSQTVLIDNVNFDVVPSSGTTTTTDTGTSSDTSTTTQASTTSTSVSDDGYLTICDPTQTTTSTTSLPTTNTSSDTTSTSNTLTSQSTTTTTGTDTTGTSTSTSQSTTNTGFTSTSQLNTNTGPSTSPTSTAPNNAGTTTSSSSSQAMTTSTVFTTQVSTIYSCAPTVKDCPYSNVVTKTIPLFTTVCPVGQTAAPQAPAAPATSSTLSTVYTTIVYTITSCAPEAQSCTIGSVTTESTSYTTYCAISSHVDETSAPASPAGASPIPGIPASASLQGPASTPGTEINSATTLVPVANAPAGSDATSSALSPAVIVTPAASVTGMATVVVPSNAPGAALCSTCTAAAPSESATGAVASPEPSTSGYAQVSPNAAARRRVGIVESLMIGVFGLFLAA